MGHQQTKSSFEIIGICVKKRWDCGALPHLARHKKWSFSLNISSLNVTNLQFLSDSVTFTEKIPN